MITLNEPVTLSAKQVQELNEKLTTLRHDVNNHLSLVMAAVELIRRRPEIADRMWQTLGDQPEKIKEALAQFSRDFETALSPAKP